MTSLFTILEAWKIAKNPTPKQLELAELRSQICDTCPAKTVITEKLAIGIICSECGCPLSKKIFTNQQNTCPLKKWTIDESFFPKETKKDTTLL